MAQPGELRSYVGHAVEVGAGVKTRMNVIHCTVHWFGNVSPQQLTDGLHSFPELSLNNPSPLLDITHGL